MKKLFFLWVSTLALLAGCETATHTSNAPLQTDYARRQVLLSDYLQSTTVLRTQGDPLGDYLWALAAENRKLDQFTTDAAAAQKMLVEAADKGSPDAAITLAVRHYQKVVTPRFSLTAEGKLQPEADAVQQREALASMQALIEKQCFYRLPVYKKACATPINVARAHVAPFLNQLGLTQDPALAKTWQQLAQSCEADPSYQAALRQCDAGSVMYPSGPDKAVVIW